MHAKQNCEISWERRLKEAGQPLVAEFWDPQEFVVGDPSPIKGPLLMQYT